MATGKPAIVPAHAAPTHNRDMGPPPPGTPASIDAIAINPEIHEAFSVYNGEAERLKRLYERLGRVSVLSIGASSTYAAYRGLWGVGPFFTALDLLAVVLGALGILLDIWIRVRDLKLRWLVNRFAADRVRSLKFQLYALAAQVRSRRELDKAARAASLARLGALAEEVKFPVGALNTFHGSTALNLAPPAPASDAHPTTPDPELLRAAVADYRVRRVRYQHAFAEQMSRDIADRRRGYDSWSDASFVLGALLLVISIALRGWPGFAPLAPYFDATGLAFFVMTAVANVLSSGAAHVASNSRYQQYARDLSRLLDVEPDTPEAFISYIERMELLALRELDDFWRDMWISSYRA